MIFWGLGGLSPPRPSVVSAPGAENLRSRNLKESYIYGQQGMDAANLTATNSDLLPCTLYRAISSTCQSLSFFFRSGTTHTQTLAEIGPKKPLIYRLERMDAANTDIHCAFYMTTSQP